MTERLSYVPRTGPPYEWRKVMECQPFDYYESYEPLSPPDFSIVEYLVVIRHASWRDGETAWKDRKTKIVNACEEIWSQLHCPVCRKPGRQHYVALHLVYKGCRVEPDFLSLLLDAYTEAQKGGKQMCFRQVKLEDRCECLDNSFIGPLARLVSNTPATFHVLSLADGKLTDKAVELLLKSFLAIEYLPSRLCSRYKHFGARLKYPFTKNNRYTTALDGPPLYVPWLYLKGNLVKSWIPIIENVYNKYLLLPDLPGRPWDSASEMVCYPVVYGRQEVGPDMTSCKYTFCNRPRSPLFHLPRMGEQQRQDDLLTGESVLNKAVVEWSRSAAADTPEKPRPLAKHSIKPQNVSSPWDSSLAYAYQPLRWRPVQEDKVEQPESKLSLELETPAMRELREFQRRATESKKENNCLQEYGNPTSSASSESEHNVKEEPCQDMSPSQKEHSGGLNDSSDQEDKGSENSSGSSRLQQPPGRRRRASESTSEVTYRKSSQRRYSSSRSSLSSSSSSLRASSSSSYAASSSTSSRRSSDSNRPPQSTHRGGLGKRSSVGARGAEHLSTLSSRHATPDSRKSKQMSEGRSDSSTISRESHVHVESHLDQYEFRRHAENSGILEPLTCDEPQSPSWHMSPDAHEAPSSVSSSQMRTRQRLKQHEQSHAARQRAGGSDLEKGRRTHHKKGFKRKKHATELRSQREAKSEIARKP